MRVRGKEGSGLKWVRALPVFERGSRLRVFAGLCLFGVVCLQCAYAQVTANTPVFGPQTYVRTTGAPNEYTTTFTAPSWIVTPYNLHIVNGDSSGNNRVSSATIALNGVQIAVPSDFNQSVATIDRSVTLQTTNTLQVTLASKPGSYLTINVAGTNGDHTPPQIKIVSPAAGGYINTATPNIEVTYSDPVGAGEPGASGVNTSTFKVTLDGVDRTSLFTVRSGDASATVPANLALTSGAHTLVASLQDNAGNQATSTSQFTVDLGVPQIQIVQPALGAYLNTSTPTISVRYSDSIGVNTSTLKVLINGTDQTSLFTDTNTGATATPPANLLVQGANQIVAQIQNLAGTLGSASTSFNVDTTPPTISIAHPAANSYHGSSTIDITVQYADDQAIDTSKLQVTVDGVSVTMAKTLVSGTASVPNVANGPHTLAASIADLAGNVSKTQITFYVDTTIPAIHVDQPAPNAILNTPTPQVAIDYSDIEGVDTTTLTVFVNNVDFTSLFSIGPSSATAQLSGAATLAEGQNTITAQIANNAGTTGTSSSTFTVDTIPPSIVFQAPPAQTNSNTPTVAIVYSDSGSGVNPYSLTVFVDGIDVSALIAPGATSATGVLQLTPPLADGTHKLSATVADRAGNVSQPATLSFVVDTTPPTVTFTTPANNSFINNPTPSIVLQYSDTGTGVASSSVQILLQQGTNAPTDITSYFQIGPQQATGAIPTAVSLNDGTYVLSAVVNDLVGNSGSARSTFVVDTVSPTSSIQAPAANAILGTSTVPVVLVYQDDRSGIDTSRVALTVDGVNQTSALTITPTGATGTLPALPNGSHTIQLTVYDRSGNAAPTVSQAFITDTAPPTISASVAPPPNAAGWNNTNVTVTFSCTDNISGVQTCPSPVVVSTEAAGQSICGQAVNGAGISSPAACAPVSLDKTPPTITASVSPSPNSNGVYTTVPVTITFTCSDSLSGVAVCPVPITINTLGINQTFSGTATDVAGNTATASVPIQTVAPKGPMISAIISPAPNARGWNNTNPTVTFACTPGTYPLASCSPPVTVTTEGAAQSVCGTAVDSTGLSASACVTVNLDKTPPTITATQTPAANSGGWNNTPVTVTFACSDSLSGVASCPPPQTVSTDGAHQVVSGTASDNAGNTASAQATVNVDQTPPSILQFTAPAQLAPGQSGTATVNATDNISVASVVIQLNGSVIATLTIAPYTTTFSAPTTANVGDTLTLTVTATDEAGNVTSSARGIQVVTAGVIAGQVLSDTTGLPFTGATVQVLGGNLQDVSDNTGRYSIPSNSPHLFLSVSSAANATAGTAATTTVEREVSLQTGVGTVPVDARLTQIAAAIPIDASGGSLVNGSLNVSVAAGAVSSATHFHLTTLSQQGLPGLLPLGWSPIAAFDLRADTVTAASFTANFTQLPNSPSLHLVRYDFNSHSWLMVTPNLSPASGSLTVPIPSVGNFALVAPDAGNTSLSVSSSGQPLTGVSMVTLPAGASASGSLNPPSVAPTGGTSSAILSVQSSVPLPSGTVIQAKVQDLYSLVSGKQLSTSPRMEDIILYQFASPPGATGAATFAVTPAQTFQPGILASGTVHLDILSGREAIRGQVGGSDAVSVTGGDATLIVAAGSLPQDTAISVAPEAIDSFLPSTSTLLPLAEYNIDLSGQILLAPAQLSVAAGSAKSGDTVVVAQIQRILGVPYLVLVSLAQVNGTNLVTQAAPGFPGITQGGDYIFYKLTSPTGYVSGIVTAATGPVPALVQTDGLPFVSFASSAGSYVVLALSGPVQLTASVPSTAVSGTASAQVVAGQTATANIIVSGQTETAIVTPPNGAVGVPLSAEIDITSPDPLNQASVTATAVTLTQNGQGTNTPVPVRFVFTLGGTRLSVFPLAALQPSATYTMSASGLANTLGGLVSVPTVTFTTQANTPPNFNTDALVFAMPDQSGNVAISAPASSFPPGTTVLIVDQTNGIVLSLTVANDGSVSGQIPATIDDVLAITITAPDKTTTSFTHSKFVAPDGTTAIGPGGGTVAGPGNTGLIIPAGALTKGTTFKLTQLDQTAFPVMPSFPGAMFAGGLHVDAPAMPVFNQEVKLAFPVPPNAPSNAFYYVYRRIIDQNGAVYWDTIDHAFVQGTGPNAQIVTASPPFCGYRNSYGNAQKTATEVMNSVFSPFVDFIVLMEIPNFDANQPGVASQGLIVGKVLQVVPPGPGQTETTFMPIGGAVVSLDTDPTRIAITDATCGTFVLFDPKFGGGFRNVTASNNSLLLHATVDEVNPVAQASAVQATFGPFSVTAGLEALYKNIGTVNFTYPPPLVVVPPQINIGVFTLDANNQRQAIKGIVLSGTALVITFASNPNLSLQGVKINGVPYDFGLDTSATVGDGLVHYALSGPYPAGAAGVTTIVATAIDPLDPQTIVTQERTFLVVTSANGSISLTPGVAPKVIYTLPINNAVNVPTTTYPQINFSEPVTNIPGNVTLVGARTGDKPELLLVGVRSDSTIANPISPTDAITSLTVQPASGLQFSEQYTLTLNSGIVDQNNPPLPLSAFALAFTTSGGQELGGTPANDSFSATRPVIIGNRAYFGVNVSSTFSGVDIVDITDPTQPKDKGVQATFIGRAMDAAGQASSPVQRCALVAQAQPCIPAQNGPLIAVAAGQPASETIVPSNVYIYDVSTPDVPNRVGAVSVTTSTTQDGLVLRLFMKDQFLYTSTVQKGLQVVDLQQALDEYQQTFTSNPVQVGQGLSTEGQGFATDTVVNTIPLPTPVCEPNSSPCQAIPDANGNPQTYNGIMWDLKVGNFAVTNLINPAQTSVQALVVATGVLPFVVADPLGAGQTTGAVLFPRRVNNYLDPSPLQFPQIFLDGATFNFVLQTGRAVALGTLSVPDSTGNSVAKQVAVVVGNGIAPPLPDGTPAQGILMVVDMTDPRNPAPIGAVQLSAHPIDLLLNGPMALIGTSAQKVLLVNLNDPRHPVAAGEIDGPTLGDHLAITDFGVIVSSSPNPTIGGAHLAGLNPECSGFRDYLRDHPPSTDPINISPTDPLAWTLNSGFSTGQTTNIDGLVVTDVRLGRRLMATMMSLPYFTIQRSNDPDPNNPPRCELSVNSTNACSVLPTARSRLYSYSLIPPDGQQTYTGVQAQYLIDLLDGDHDQDQTKHDSCVLVTQRYEFYREGLKPFEPFGFFPSAKYRPLVTYHYFTDAGGPALKAFTTAQRIEFDARDVNNAPLPKAAANGSMLVCDPDPLLLLPCVSSGLGFQSFVGMFKNQNPLQNEAYLNVISGGKIVNFVSDPLGNKYSQPVDNYHSSPEPLSDVDQPMDEPGANHFGCEACAHMHWRWSSALTPGTPSGNLIGVDSMFDSNDGLPIIASQFQDVSIALLRSDTPGEVHPQRVSDLYDPQKSILPSQLIAANAKPVFWYIATSTAVADEFFDHGGGFGTYFVNKISVPSSAPLQLQIEHTRPLTCTVTVAITMTTEKGPFVLPADTFTVQLDATTDDIIAPSTDAWSLFTSSMDVDVELDDLQLKAAGSPKYIYKKHFSFNAPAAKEP